MVRFDSATAFATFIKKITEWPSFTVMTWFYKENSQSRKTYFTYFKLFLTRTCLDRKNDKTLYAPRNIFQTMITNNF